MILKCSKCWVLLAGWFCLSVASVEAQVTEVSQTSNSRENAPGVTNPPLDKYLGSDRCDQCHFNPTPRVVRDFAMLTEASQFIAHDKHSQAFSLLKGELGQQMGRLLGLNDVTLERQCLSCHANWQSGHEQPVRLEMGVSCESCHGPSSRWDLPHSEPKWRLVGPDAKAALGMVDVRNPVRRSEQCFSCHIGNVAEGKVITHAMYAAGHPPLPGIEIESFVEQMPAHWRTLTEKGEFEHRDAYLKLNSPQDPTGSDLPRTRGVLIGGFVALRESLELIADQARQRPDEWPELAAFDCQACHHDLRSPSWRQERIPLAAPGRPSLPEWPFALVKVGLRQISGDNPQQFAALRQAFHQHRKDLFLSIQKQPFGERVATQAAISKFLNWLQPNLVALETSRFDQAAAERARLELTLLTDSEFPDFHSARQLVWALGIIDREIATNQQAPLSLKPIPDKESVTQRRTREEANIRQLLDWRENVAKPRQQAWIAQWGNDSTSLKLPLMLPAGVGKVNDSDVPESLIVENLPGALEAISSYDAVKFRQELLKFKESKR
jgi:hypothetical protein